MLLSVHNKENVGAGKSGDTLWQGVPHPQSKAWREVLSLRVTQRLQGTGRSYTDLQVTLVSVIRVSVCPHLQQSAPHIDALCE